MESQWKEPFQGDQWDRETAGMESFNDSESNCKDS